MALDEVKVELDHDFVHRYLHGDEVEKELRQRLEAGAAYWTDHARWRTGFMANAVVGEVVHEIGGQEGVLEMYADYSPYQEYGTRYIEGMHILADVLAEMARNPA